MSCSKAEPTYLGQWETVSLKLGRMAQRGFNGFRVSYVGVM